MIRRLKQLWRLPRRLEEFERITRETRETLHGSWRNYLTDLGDPKPNGLLERVKYLEAHLSVQRAKLDALALAAGYELTSVPASPPTWVAIRQVQEAK